MKLKKIMIVGLILLAILTIGAVSASDASDELAISNSSDDAVEASLDDLGVLADDGDEEDEPGVDIWVDEENSYTTDENSEDADERFATICVPEGTDENVLVSISSDDSIFEKKLNEFDEGKVDDHTDPGVVYYNISPKDVGFFNGLEDGSEIEMALWDPNDDEEPIAYKKYEIAFNSDDSTFTLSEISDDEENGFGVNFEKVISKSDGDAVVVTVKDNSINKVSIKDTTIGAVLFDNEIEVPDEGYNICLTDLNLNNVNDKDIISFVYYYENEKGELENSTQDYAIKVTADSIELFEYDPVTTMEFYSFYGDLTTGNHNEMGWLPDGKFFEIISPEVVSEITVTVNGTGFSKTYTINDMGDEYNPEGNYIYYRSGYSYFVMLDDNIKSSLPENEIITFNYICGDANITQKRIRYDNYVKKIVTPDDIATLFTVTVADGKLSDVNEVAVSIYPTFYANIQSIGIELGSGYFNVSVDNIVKNQTTLEYLCWGRLVNLDLTLADLGITEPGTYNIKVTHYPDFVGDTIYPSETEITSENVVFDNTNYTIDISSINSDVVITLTADDKAIAGADITYSLNGGSEVDATTDENGKVTVAAPEGNVLVNVKFANKEESKTLHFPVSTVITITNSTNNVIITLTDAVSNKVAGARITYSSNGAERIGVTDENGTFTIIGLTGEVSIKVSYWGSDDYKPVNASAEFNFTSADNKTDENITLSKIATTLTAPGFSMVYQTSKSFVVTLKDADGNPISGASLTIDFGTVKYNVQTDANGKASCSISFVPKTYTATVTYAGNDTYAGSKTTAKVTVTKAKPKLIAGAKASLKSKKYVVTLKDSKNKVIKKATITIKVKGTTYKATANSKGKATFKITKFTKKAKYAAKIKFLGNSNFKALTKSVKITVK